MLQSVQVPSGNAVSLLVNHITKSTHFRYRNRYRYSLLRHQERGTENPAGSFQCDVGSSVVQLLFSDLPLAGRTWPRRDLDKTNSISTDQTHFN